MTDGRNRNNGVVIGIVTDLEDEEGLGRVKVRYPTLDDQQSDWARLVVPMAGANRGTFFRPEKDDEVLVAFELGNPRRPYILGSLWSRPDKPPRDDGKPKENNWRFIQSRSGHRILLDDTRDKERIEIQDKDGTRRVLIDSAAGKIRIVCDAGDVEVEAPSGAVKVQAATVEIKASGTMAIEAGGALTIKGATVNIN